MPNILSTTLKQHPCYLPESLPYIQHNTKIINLPNPTIQVHCGELPFALIKNEGVSKAKYQTRVRSRAITGVSVDDTPTRITSIANGLPNGSLITISGTTTTPSINGLYVITVIDDNTFSIPVTVNNVTIGVGIWTKYLMPVKSCAAFSMITNLHIPESKLDMCNYPSYDTPQLQALINKRDALPSNEQCNILNPNDKSLWYQKIAIQSNMPASIPFTQHIRETKAPYPTYYPPVEDCCPPGKRGPCSDCVLDDDGENCNSRLSCNYHPFPLSGPMLKCPPVQSIPYTQHKICPVSQKVFGSITTANFGNLLNYSITLVNNLINHYSTCNSFNTSISSINITTSKVNLTPIQIYNGIIHVPSSNTMNSELYLPTAAEMCTKLKGIVGDTTGQTFLFVISNAGTGNITLKAVDQAIYSTWNATTEYTLEVRQSAEFKISIRSCQAGQESYFVIKNNYST